MANVRKDLRRDQLTVEQVFGDTQNLYNEAVTAAVLSSSARTDFTGHLSAAIGQAQNRVASASPSDHSHPSTPGRSSHSTQSYTQSAAGYLTSPKILRYYNRLRREDSASGADEKTLGLIMAEGRKEPAAFLSYGRTRCQLATARDHLGQTLLHLAAEYESPNAFKLIAWLAKDVAVPIDAMDFQQQRTALMRAVVGKKTQTVKILLDCGASFTKRDGLGVTPAIYAAQENVKEVLWILVNRDEGVLYQTDVNFCNCIHWACSKGHTGIVRYLSDLKADFGHVDESGNTPLLRAIQAEELGIAQLLLERKLGSVNDKNKDGLDAFGMAATRSAVANKQFIDMYDHMQATAIDDTNADAAESDDDGPGSPGGGEDHDDSNTQSLPGVGDTTKTNPSSLANMNGVRQRMRARGKKIFSTVRSLIRFRLPKKGRFGLMFKNVQYARRFFRQVFVPHAGPCVVLFLLFLTILLRRKILCPRGEADKFSHGDALLQHTSDATPTSAAWLNVNSGQTSPESSADIPTVDPLNAGFELAPSVFSRILHSVRSAFAFASLLAAVLSLFECGIGVFFVLSLFADPGNHPKAADGRQALLRHFRELDSAKLLESHDPKTTKASMSKNFRYCDACHIEKGSRVEHCQSSNFCVTEYDHYSPWVNNAVGRGNHRFYLLWLVSIAGQCGVCTLAYGKCFFGELLGLGSSSRGGSTSTSSGGAADGEPTRTPSSDASRAGITRRPPADIASPAPANGNYELNLNLDDSAPQTFCGEVLYLSLLAAAVVAHGLLFLWAWKLLKKQARLIGQNLTCNESDNRIRYEHFWVKKDLEGGGKIEFVNPYDLGSRKANWVASSSEAPEPSLPSPAVIMAEGGFYDFAEFRLRRSVSYLMLVACLIGSMLFFAGGVFTTMGVPLRFVNPLVNWPNLIGVVYFGISAACAYLQFRLGLAAGTDEEVLAPPFPPLLDPSGTAGSTDRSSISVSDHSSSPTLLSGPPGSGATCSSSKIRHNLEHAAVVILNLGSTLFTFGTVVLAVPSSEERPRWVFLYLIFWEFVVGSLCFFVYGALEILLTHPAVFGCVFGGGTTKYRRNKDLRPQDERPEHDVDERAPEEKNPTPQQESLLSEKLCGWADCVGGLSFLTGSVGMDVRFFCPGAPTKINACTAIFEKDITGACFLVGSFLYGSSAMLGFGLWTVDRFGWGLFLPLSHYFDRTSSSSDTLVDVLADLHSKNEACAATSEMKIRILSRGTLTSIFLYCLVTTLGFLNVCCFLAVIYGEEGLDALNYPAVAYQFLVLSFAHLLLLLHSDMTRLPVLQPYRFLVLSLRALFVCCGVVELLTFLAHLRRMSRAIAASSEA
eukprot:g2841.t1